jgi:hypothetical protein
MDYQRQNTFVPRSPNRNQNSGGEQHALAAKRKADDETQYFWHQVGMNQNASSQNIFPKNKDREKALLDNNQMKDCKMKTIDDSIPVERSGPRAEEIQPIENFSDLNGKVPSFLLENIEAMKFERPSPIQKHAVPFGLEGLDLICCSQTVSSSILITIYIYILDIIIVMHYLCALYRARVKHLLFFFLLFHPSMQ